MFVHCYSKHGWVGSLPLDSIDFPEKNVTLSVQDPVMKGPRKLLFVHLTFLNRIAAKMCYMGYESRN